SDGATYNIIVEDSIEMPWHLGNPPTEPASVNQVQPWELTATSIIVTVTQGAVMDPILATQRVEMAKLPALCSVSSPHIVNLRSYTDVTVEVEVQVPPNQRLDVLEIRPDPAEPTATLWYLVRTVENDIGWVRQEVMEPITDCPE
ncbi:MAG: hypothetical protein CL607_20225, partial [Anaerolineaceae bacterium]|nr:hypothetical protein [Anaerolineaceae bacterium]